MWNVLTLRLKKNLMSPYPCRVRRRRKSGPDDSEREGKLGILRLCEYQPLPSSPLFFPPSAIPGPLENRMAEHRDPFSLFLGRGQHNTQPPKPQPEQDHATEAPSSCCTWNRMPTRSRARAIPTARTL